MSIHINEVLEYLDTHPICCHNGNIESLMEMLHDAYVTHNFIDCVEIRNLFCSFRDLLEMLPSNDSEHLFSCVCDLCVEHEVLAFSHGIVVGMHLMTEVNRLP